MAERHQTVHLLPQNTPVGIMTCGKAGVELMRQLSGIQSLHASFLEIQAHVSDAESSGFAHVTLDESITPEHFERAFSEWKTLHSFITATSMAILVADFGDRRIEHIISAVAFLCKQSGRNVVGLMQFSQARYRKTYAFEGLRKVLKSGIPVVLFPYNSGQSLVLQSQRVVDAAQGFAELLQKPGFINLDVNDVFECIGTGTTVLFGYGEASGPECEKAAASQAIDSCSLRTYVVTHVLIQVSCRGHLTMRALNLIVELVKMNVSYTADIVFGQCLLDDLADTVKVRLYARVKTMEEPE
jgi:cell division GTPase FtsZ